MPISATTGVRTTSAATNLSKLLQDVYLAKKFIPFLHKNLVIAQFGDEENIPQHSGNKVRWLFHNALAKGIASDGGTAIGGATALAEGADPAQSVPTTVNFIEGTLSTYGSYIEFTEELEDYAHPETMSQFSKLLGEQAARVADYVIQTISGGILGTSTSQYAGTAMNANALRLAANQLRKNDALPHPKTPNGKFYGTVLSPEQSDDMAGEGNPTWAQIKTPTHWAAFTDPMDKPGMDEGAGGAPRVDVECLYNCAIYTSTSILPDSSSPVRDQGYVFADNSFGISSFESNIMKPTVRIVDPVPSLASPLGRRGLYLWKYKFVSQLFDSKRLCLLTSDEG